jgi:hypothetical protein
MFNGSTFSEIAALITIIVTTCGILGGLLVLWLNTKFVNKRAYYTQRHEDEADRAMVSSLAKEADREFRASLMKHMEDLTKEFSAFKANISEWQSAQRERLAVVEDRQNRTKRRPGSGR